MAQVKLTARPSESVKATATVTDLTRKGTRIKCFGATHNKEYLSLKTEYVTTDPAFAGPWQAVSFEVVYGCFKVGIGTILMQNHDGRLFPVTYISKKLRQGAEMFDCQTGVLRYFVEC